MLPVGAVVHKLQVVCIQNTHARSPPNSAADVLINYN